MPARPAQPVHPCKVQICFMVLFIVNQQQKNVYARPNKLKQQTTAAVGTGVWYEIYLFCCHVEICCAAAYISELWTQCEKLSSQRRGIIAELPPRKICTRLFWHCLKFVRVPASYLCSSFVKLERRRRSFYVNCCPPLVAIIRPEAPDITKSAAAGHIILLE
jgi:hypothetical protein